MSSATRNSTFFGFAGPSAASAQAPVPRSSAASARIKQAPRRKNVRKPWWVTIRFLVDRMPSIKIAARPQMPHAPGDPFLALVEAGLGFTADPLDLDGVGTAKPDAVHDLPDPCEVDTSGVANG